MKPQSLRQVLALQAVQNPRRLWTQFPLYSFTWMPEENQLLRFSQPWQTGMSEEKHSHLPHHALTWSWQSCSRERWRIIPSCFWWTAISNSDFIRLVSSLCYVVFLVPSAGEPINLQWGLPNMKSFAFLISFMWFTALQAWCFLSTFPSFSPHAGVEMIPGAVGFQKSQGPNAV